MSPVFENSLTSTNNTTARNNAINPTNRLIHNTHPNYSTTKENSISSSRRGRIPIRKSSDPFPEATYGDTIHTKDNMHLRVFFQNVKGLNQTTTSDDYQYYSQALRDLRVDISCLTETNKPWQLPHHKHDFMTASKKILRNYQS